MCGRSAIEAAADGSKSIASYVLTWNNLRTAATVSGEAMKVGFALHHPVLALGMKLLGDYKFALGAVGAGVLTAVEAIKWMGEQVERVNDIIAKSEKAGVSGTFFQVWTEQAVQARLSVEEMEKALAHASNTVRPTFDHSGEQQINSLTRWSDELQNGRHFATESYDAIKNAGQDMDKWHQAIALVVQDYQRAAVSLDDMSLKAKAVQIAVEFWGEPGRKLAQALDEGKLSIRDIAKAAQDSARVYSQDLLNATRDVNQQLAEAEKHLSDALHPNMEGLVRLSNDVKALWSSIVEYAARFASIVNRLPGLGPAAGAEYAGKVIGASIAAGEGRGPFGALTSGASGDPAFPDIARAIAARERPRYRDFTTPVPANVPLPPNRKSLTEIATASPHVAAPKETSEAQSAIDQYIASLEKANAVALAELDTIGKSNIEKAKAVDLARAEEAAKKDGVALSDEQRAKVLALAEAEGRLKDQTEETNKAIANRKAMGDYFGNMGESAVEKLIVDHKALRDVLGDVVKELERAAIKWALLGNGFGQSGGGGLFSSLFGGKGGEGGLFSGFSLSGIAKIFGFANGGMVGAGGTPMLVPMSAFMNAPRFADGGGIPAIVHAGEIILNQAQQKNVAGAMGRGNVTVHNYAAGVDVTPQITPEGVDFIVRSRIAQNNAAIPGMLRDKQDRSY